MDLHKLNAEDLRKYESGKLRETATEVLKELAKIRMDIYTARNLHIGKIRGLKKTLARVLTIQAQKQKAEGPKPKAQKPAPAPKAAKKAASEPKAAKPAKAEKSVAKATPKTEKKAPKAKTKA